MEKLSSGKDGHWKFRKLYNKAWPFYEKRYELCLLYHRTGISDPRGLYRPNVCTWLKLFRSINVYRTSLQLASAWLATFHGCSIQSPECTETSKDVPSKNAQSHTTYIYHKYDFFAWHFENAKKILVTCILKYIVNNLYFYCKLTHMLMSKPNNFL